MKTVIVFAFCVVALLGAPSEVPEETAAQRALPALEHKDVRDGSGGFELRFSTAEGTKVVERGYLVPTPDGSDHVLVYDGEYSYIGDDGKTYVTKYTTNIEGAHQPSGDHLPKAPEPEPTPKAE